MPLLLCAALGLIACDPLKLNPDLPPPVEEEPPPLELQVTLTTEGPAFCREGTWMLSVSVAGGTPERVELSTHGQPPVKLDSPYQYSVDCATAYEGSYSFVARATAEGRTFESASASVVVDRTAPRITSWRPKTFYPTVDTPVEMVFSEPLLPESLQAAPTLLRDGNGFSVPHQAVLTEEGRVLRLVPSAPLQSPVTLYVELVQRSMTDRAGNPLEVEPSEVYYQSQFNYWPFARWAEAPMSEKSIEGVSFTLETFPQTRPAVAFVEREIGGPVESPPAAPGDGRASEQAGAPAARGELEGRHGARLARDRPREQHGADSRVAVRRHVLDAVGRAARHTVPHHPIQDGAGHERVPRPRLSGA
jgi:hypothetical protein